MALSNAREYAQEICRRMGFALTQGEPATTDEIKQFAEAQAEFRKALNETAKRMYGEKSGEFIVRAIEALMVWAYIGGRSTTFMALPNDMRRSALYAFSNMSAEDVIKKSTSGIAAVFAKIIEESGDAA